MWETNHSYQKLCDEEAMDFAAYQLGYQMKEQSDDPSRKAYKHFNAVEHYPEGNLTDIGYNENLPVWLMADFNRHTMGWALGQIHRSRHASLNRYVVFDEIYNHDKYTTEQAELAVAKLESYGITHVHLVGDNTSNQKSGNYGRRGKNDWDEVREVLDFYNISYKNELGIQNPKRKVRVDKVNNAIYAGERGERRLLVNTRCEKVIRDYRYAIVDEKDGLKIDDGDIGHISDAVDYWVYRNEGGGAKVMYVLG